MAAWHSYMDRRDISRDFFRRETDTCTDTYGPDWTTNTCTPGFTECCVQENKSTPSCVQAAGIGWCCGSDGMCYTTLDSVCLQPNAVQCPSTSSNKDPGCCPGSTVCSSKFNNTQDTVKCEIARSNLNALAAGGSGSGVKSSSVAAGTSSSAQVSASASSSLAATTIIVTASGVTTSSAISNTASRLTSSISYISSSTTHLQTSLPTAVLSNSTSGPSIGDDHSGSDGPSTGAIAGIAVGSAGAALLLAFVAFFFYRRRKQQRRVSAHAPNVYGGYHSTPEESDGGHEMSAVGGSSSKKSTTEIMSKEVAVEMTSEREMQELASPNSTTATTKKAQTGQATYELE